MNEEYDNGIIEQLRSNCNKKRLSEVMEDILKDKILEHLKKQTHQGKLITNRR